MKIIIYLAYIFLLSEIILFLTKRSKKRSVKKKTDKGSLILLWITITISLTVGFNLAKYQKWDSSDYIIAVFGLFIYLLGLVIRWATIISLKKAFTVDVAINQTHQLKTDGLYKIVRHPSYLGLIMIIAGLSIGMNSLLSFLIVIISVFLAIIYRIYVEEKVLIEEFGDGYREYCGSTKRLIPYIY